MKELRLLCESMLIPVERRTLIQKLVEREVFLTKPKHQCHLSQGGECVCGAQPWKVKRLSHESMIILIDKWSLILKNGGNWSFSIETKASIHLPNEETEFGARNP